MEIVSKILAVGFADLQRYHKYVLKYGGKAAIELLSETYNLAGNIIIKNNGKIIKYIGDAILFVLEDPSKSEIVAKEIVDCFIKDFDNFSIRYNVAIATGEVFMTNIGHNSLKMDDIFGETVNKSFLLNRELANSQEYYVLCDDTIKHLERK